MSAPRSLGEALLAGQCVCLESTGFDGATRPYRMAWCAHPRLSWAAWWLLPADAETHLCASGVRLLPGESHEDAALRGCRAWLDDKAKAGAAYRARARAEHARMEAGW